MLAIFKVSFLHGIFHKGKRGKNFVFVDKIKKKMLNLQIPSVHCGGSVSTERLKTRKCERGGAGFERSSKSL